MKIFFYALVLMFELMLGKSQAQTVLQANGPGNTYELINSVLAPGNTSVEATDQCLPAIMYGKRIAEVMDATLNKFVFEFYIYKDLDNDRCINYDRQRVEIKTYEPSPPSLLATPGETVTYKWRFRLAAGFQPSPNFTHIHQIKAVGGDDDDPIFTLTCRAGSPNKLELIYVQASTGSSNVYLATAPLSSFLGTWVEATEQVKFGANGTYSMQITRVSDGAVLLNYSNNNILTYRSDNDFCRPKWGIYRSLNSPSFLRDDTIRFDNFTIFEGAVAAAPSGLNATAVSTSQINLSWVDNASNESGFRIERSPDGVNNWTAIANTAANANSFANTSLPPATTYYYRIRSENFAGNSTYSNVATARTQDALPVRLLSFEGKLKNQRVLLSWAVAEEINLNKYEIETSVNGLLYKIIGTTNPKGNNQHYQYTQTTPAKGNNYYRLKMIDKDGSYQYSPIVLLANTVAGIYIYPNPASQFFTISQQDVTVSPSQFLLINAKGQLVKSIIPTTNATKILIQNIPSGKYQLQVLQQGKPTKNFPMVIAH